MRRYICITLFLFKIVSSEVIRDIFEYDTDWRHADYDIIAHGQVHETGKTFKVLQCGPESKVIFEK